ncbi:DEAD/DEAH box helicase, partial [Candidatus Poribacteria bacterium]|nr:DEAD/DEAH box helicase [Candidatus Poribacteria bacterium]
MSSQSEFRDYGVHSTVSGLNENLRAYVEAQYHIRDEGLIRERRRLLEEPGTVAQLPYVESTPVYQLGNPYADLNVPAPVKQTLSALVELDVGIYRRPYVHQAKALEDFFTNGRDLIIATGTGSGKTESFLMPIIGKLAIESASCPASAELTGCRALLLYPMNALVNDQLSRVRKLFGSPQSSTLISQGRSRPVNFGSYTGRTPYPGPRTSSRDTQRIEPLFENHYLIFCDDDEKLGELQRIGQWPCKDLKTFYGKEFEEVRQTSNGQLRVYRNWKERLKTQPNDRELMTRHEMQEHCPDLLITNYSMLEYMLMRPIERSIFTSTRNWLNADEDNEFILVLDEAHMYRGAGGAEVALLIRRLAQRLEIPRERMRCILTSASLGEEKDVDESVLRFARDLTGLTETSTRQFTLIKGELEPRTGQRAASTSETAALAAFDLANFQNVSFDETGARTSVASLAEALDWKPLNNTEDLAGFLFDRLSGFGPLESLIKQVSGSAMALHDLENSIFPEKDDRKKAMAALLALTTFAKRNSDKRVLLPTRLHLLFRGLPGLFACCNPNCCKRRGGDTDAASLLGRLYTQASYTCDCPERARIYELLTHRGTCKIPRPSRFLPDRRL